MKPFTIVNTQGQILATGVCQSETFDMQVSGTDRIFEGTYSDDKYYWDGEFKLIPEKPVGEGYEFDYVTKQWVLNEDAIWQNIIAQRNSLLYASDWTQNADSPLSEEQKQFWREYRQNLRDITNQQLPVVFPTPPQG